MSKVFVHSGDFERKRAVSLSFLGRRAFICCCLFRFSVASLMKFYRLKVLTLVSIFARTKRKNVFRFLSSQLFPGCYVRMGRRPAKGPAL